ncbi:thioredoxin family protein [Promicromonospora sp. NPDC050880]|uniref:thioredoxin family protein n=1 Tax=unclassified Promicromonospora TaxID=2647929 RepID=UPI0037A2D04A
MSAVQFELFTSAFCGPCHHTRAVLAEAVRIVPGATMVEHDVAHEAGLAESLDIRSTPMVLVRDADGAEVFRAAGAPTVAQVLVAAERALR